MPTPTLALIQRFSHARVLLINTRDIQVLGAYTPDLAFDGDNSSVPSRWVSDIAYPQHWLAVDLGQLYLLEAVALVTG